MNIIYNERNLYPEELRLLKAIRTKTEKAQNSVLKVKPYLIALLIGTGSTSICTIIPDSFWTFLLGTTAVFSFGFVVFTPYEQFKLIKQHKSILNLIESFLNTELVKTCRINAEKIALAPEYEDETDLYLIKMNEHEVLHLWDLEDNLKKKFPCLDFEVYEESFFTITGRQIYPLSDKIEPEKISKKAKWNYMSKYGVQGQLEVENANFEQLIEKYKKSA